MDHGIDGYFAECARFARRVSLLTVTVGLGGLGLLWGARARVVQHAITNTVRFGFEGPDQYVRRITLQQLPGTGSSMRQLGHVESGTGTRGGGTARSAERGLARERRPRLPELGDADANLAGQRTSRLPNVDIVQSEELAILIRPTPVYPPAAFEMGLEGKVEIEGLIDTTGHVVQVTVLECDGDRQFEQAASEAVWQFLFAPYRVKGVVQPVYAAFHIRFEITVKERTPDEPSKP